MSQISFVLEPAPPFRLDLTAWTLRRRSDNAMDRWDGQTYRRALALASGAVEVAVTQVASPEQPRLVVTVTGAPLPPDAQPMVTRALERMLGLRIDLEEFYQLAVGDAMLGPLAARFRGLKPPRFPSVFEALTNGIACQQITLTQGIRVLNRLSQRFGPTVQGQDASAQAFPGAADLARQEPAALAGLGLSGQKIQALLALSRAVADGSLDLEGLAALPDEQALAALQRLRGIGRWTAEYALLRGLGRIHLFPGDDVGARNNLQRWLKLTEALNYAGVQRAIADWRAYGGLLYFHLLLDRLAEAGYVS